MRCFGAQPIGLRSPGAGRWLVDRVAQEVGYGRLCRAKDEGKIVNASGALMIPWPHRTDGVPLEFDALLTIATDPTIVDARYPSAQEIASRWKEAPGKPHVE